MIKAKKIYFLGIAGSGCSSMALWLKSHGFDVAGSDICESKITENLVKEGIGVQIGHYVNEEIKDSDLIVYSSAIKNDNPELLFARNNGKTVIKRAEMLGMMMEEEKISLAVCGSAGKSSTTGFFASVLNAAEKNPSVIVGGIFVGKENGMQIGKGDYFLAEADEYDRSFFEMRNIDLAICTGIEEEHLDIYKSLEGVKDGFVRFFSRVNNDGVIVACFDSRGVREVYSGIDRKKVSFGFSKDSDYRADDVKYENGKTVFNIYKNEKLLGNAKLKLFGKHNVLNALGSIAAALEMNIPFEVAVTGAGDFGGIKRRIEKVAEINNISIFSDYAHHPTKISATLLALKNIMSHIEKKRIITIFQPHTFTRVRDFAQSFAKSLENGSDIVMVTQIYPAREKPIEGVSEENIAAFFEKETSSVVKKENIAKECKKIAEKGDIIVVMGAGDVDEEIKNLIMELSNG